MVDSAGARSGNLFAEKRVFRSNPAARSKQAPELEAARALCHQLRNKRTRPDKARLVHLICLNLQAILKHRSRQA
ncbi:MAG TPA: hypothetical protein VFA36_08415 [Burkholderiales bacterium]|jgi:hypothetical protein|nr:hypothetical protein [Burkholderiales bacterium]